MPLFKYYTEHLNNMKFPYKKRFLSFQKGICPYCGFPASLEESQPGTYYGYCINCNSYNKFTNKKCKSWSRD